MTENSIQLFNLMVKPLTEENALKILAFMGKITETIKREGRELKAMRGIDPDAPYFPYGDTLLIRAIKSMWGCPEAARDVYQRIATDLVTLFGANVNVRNLVGATALDVALFGANVNMRILVGTAASEVALRIERNRKGSGGLGIAIFLREHGARESAKPPESASSSAGSSSSSSGRLSSSELTEDLIKLICSKDPEKEKKFFELFGSRQSDIILEGVPTISATMHRSPILCYVVAQGTREMVAALTTIGADVNFKYKDGTTLLDVAERRTDEEGKKIATFLRDEKGLISKKTTEKERTPSPSSSAFFSAPPAAPASSTACPTVDPSPYRDPPPWRADGIRPQCNQQ